MPVKKKTDAMMALRFQKAMRNLALPSALLLAVRGRVDCGNGHVEIDLISV